MGSGPDQIIELDDNLNQLDPQTYRMEPATERGVVPCHVRMFRAPASRSLEGATLVVPEPFVPARRSPPDSVLALFALPSSRWTETLCGVMRAGRR